MMLIINRCLPNDLAGDRMPTPGGQTYADNLIGGGFFYGSEHGIGYGGSRSDDIGLGLSDRHGMSSLGGFGAGLFGNEGKNAILYLVLNNFM